MASLPSAVPATHQEKFLGFGLAVFCQAASQEGGDFCEILPSANGSALLAIGDVMGKGARAARIAAQLRPAIWRAARTTSHLPDILALVNQLVLEELFAADVFATIQLARINSQQAVLEIANAGHCPLLTLSRTGMVQTFSPDGMPLGIAPNVPYSLEVLSLEHLSSLLMYTDGLTEARNPNGQLFGSQWLEDWLKHKTHSGSTAHQLSEKLVAELKGLQGNSQPGDDQAFLLATREAPSDVHFLTLEPTLTSELDSLQAAA